MRGKAAWIQGRGQAGRCGASGRVTGRAAWAQGTEQGRVVWGAGQMRWGCTAQSQDETRLALWSDRACDGAGAAKPEPVDGARPYTVGRLGRLRRSTAWTQGRDQAVTVRRQRGWPDPRKKVAWSQKALILLSQKQRPSYSVNLTRSCGPAALRPMKALPCGTATCRNIPGA
jgi:hypothetical protein